MRLQLFEFTDLAWYPGFLKQPIQDYLDYVSSKMRVFAGVVPLLARALRKSGEHRVMDLGSGAGGGTLHVWENLREEFPNLNVTMSDKFPCPLRREYADAGITAHPTSVDATNVPEELTGFRTMFTVAHHFRPDTLRAIFADARRKRRGIAVFEPVQRSALQFFAMVLLVPWIVWILTPAILARNPERPGLRLLFTYVLPLIPLSIAWDGAVSVLRAYRAGELLELAEPEDRTFDWESGELRDGGTVVTYLIGTPTAR